MKADFVVYETNNFQNILYNQGSLVASEVYIDGRKYSNLKSIKYFITIQETNKKETNEIIMQKTDII